MIKALDRWLLPWISQRFRRPKTHVSDVMLAVCDHFEPLHRTDKTGAMRRLAQWRERLPSLTDSSSDHEGAGAKHTFSILSSSMIRTFSIRSRKFADGRGTKSKCTFITTTTLPRILRARWSRERRICAGMGCWAVTRRAVLCSGSFMETGRSTTPTPPDADAACVENSRF